MRGTVALLFAAACSRGTPDSWTTPTRVEAGAPSASIEAQDRQDRPATSTPIDTPLASAFAPLEPLRASPAGRPSLPPAPSGEAVRTALPALEHERRLRSQLGKLREHFGVGAGPAQVALARAPRETASGPFTEQRVELAGGRTGVLVSRVDESNPIVLALDQDALLFAKTRPTAGIVSPVVHPTIAPGPEGGVALFVYVSSMHIVAARMWADDGNPYAEIEVFRPDACATLAVAYAPNVGWIVACSSDAGTWAQRLQEDLTDAWPRDGLPVGPRSAVVGRPAIAFDGGAGWTLRERAKAVGGDRHVTVRYGLDGEAR